MNTLKAFFQAHPRLAKFAVISVKHGVNALLTNATLSQILPSVFNFHSVTGVIAFAKVSAAVIASREAAVWLPWVLKWSQENLNFTNGGS